MLGILCHTGGSLPVGLLGPKINRVHNSNINLYGMNCLKGGLPMYLFFSSGGFSTGRSSTDGATLST